MLFEFNSENSTVVYPWTILKTTDQVCNLSSFSSLLGKSAQLLTHSLLEFKKGFGASQVVLVGKKPPVNVGDLRDMGLILGWEDPLEKEMTTIPAFWPGKSHGQRSLSG